MSHSDLEVSGPNDGRSGTCATNRRTEQDNRAKPATCPEALQARAARAKLIEDTTYRMTDLFTIVVGRIEILIDKLPATHRADLAAIRNVVLDGVKLNDQLLLVSRACRRDLDL